MKSRLHNIQINSFPLWQSGRRLVVFCLISLALVCAEGPLAENDAKALYVYHFAQFTNWPAGAFETDSSPLVIGILGADPFGGALDQVIKGETVDKRKLLIRRSGNVNDLKGCNILFIGQNEAGRLAQIIASLQGTNVLTVSDIPQFCRQGGMIGIQTEKGKVIFEINVGAARRAGLRLSSQLLKLARKIVD